MRLRSRATHSVSAAVLAFAADRFRPPREPRRVGFFFGAASVLAAGVASVLGSVLATGLASGLAGLLVGGGG